MTFCTPRPRKCVQMSLLLKDSEEEVGEEAEGLVVPAARVLASL